MRKTAAITVLLLLALAGLSAVSTAQAGGAAAAELGGSAWYFMAGGGVYELRPGDCGFSPCDPDTGEYTSIYDMNGAYITDLGAWGLEGRIFSIGSLFRGILSQDGGMIVGEDYILIRINKQ